jgi:hypothetical protein
MKIKCVHSRVNVHNLASNKCPIYTHDGASAKFSDSSHKTDNSAVGGGNSKSIYSIEDIQPFSPMYRIVALTCIAESMKKKTSALNITTC